MLALYFYRALTVLVAPFLSLLLRRRLRRGKEDPQRIGERSGYASAPRPQGMLVWLHAASVGEAQSILPLMQKLAEQHPHAHLLLTTGTVTSARLVEGRLPARAIHQFIPVDSWLAVRRFLRHWQPDIAIWTESELWPNLITMTRATGAKMVLLNARMSAKSFHSWRRFGWIIRPLIGAFDFICPQSTADEQHYAALGAKKLHMVGNLKYDAPPLPMDMQEIAALGAQINGRPFWVAASTHPGEEAQIANAHQQLLRDYPDLLTIIAPRHAVRGATIAQELAANGYAVAQRSAQEAITPKTAIYLADTMGELGLFYRISPVVFIGGSLVPHGGQNPLEPARLDCALLTGMHTGNFTAIYDELEQAGAVRRVADTAALAQKVARLLGNPAKQAALAEAAHHVANSKCGVVDAMLALLAPFLKAEAR